jgi:hypothetical protein
MPVLMQFEDTCFMTTQGSYEAEGSDLVKALVRAHRWRRRIEDGRQPKGLRLTELLGKGPAAWHAQRESVGCSN